MELVLRARDARGHAGGRGRARAAVPPARRRWSSPASSGPARPRSSRASRRGSASTEPGRVARRSRWSGSTRGASRSPTSTSTGSTASRTSWTWASTSSATGDDLLLVEWGDVVEELLPAERLRVELTTEADGRGAPRIVVARHGARRGPSGGSRSSSPWRPGARRRDRRGDRDLHPADQRGAGHRAGDPRRRSRWRAAPARSR